MRRICKYCGREYEGDPSGSCCPACAAEQRRTSVRQRICQTCGATFQGGPAALYCPDCRTERKREQYRKFRQQGAHRKLGSTDFCVVCGKPYVVHGGQQHYCPDCRPIEYRRLDREASRRWNAENTTPDGRRAERQAASAPISCVICGKLFVPQTTTITCSPECRAEYRRRKAREYEQGHQDNRNEYHREMRRQLIARMTPEELQRWRADQNAKARERYRKRMERKKQGE